MRLSTLQTFNTGLNNILRVNAQANETQAQISTGRRVLQASDDPIAASRILQLNQELASRGQYTKNIEATLSNLSLSESALSTMNGVLQRLRELSVQAGNGALSQQDRQSIGNEAGERLKEVLALMNTRDATGEYLFAGFKGSTTPFVDNGSGNFRYEGDEGVREVQIGPTTYIAARDSGKDIFEDIAAYENTFRTRENPRNTAEPPARIDAGLVIDQATFDEFYPDNFYIEFNPAADVTPPGPNYTVRRIADNRVIDGQQNVSFVSGGAIEFAGMQVRVSGNPAAGDSFVIESTAKQGLLTTISRFADAMKTLPGDTPDQKARLADMIDTTIANLGTAENSLLATRSSIGGRINALESTKIQNQDVDLVTQEVLSKLQDTDFTEAVSRLSLQTFVLEAAQQSYARIANLSLFNSL